jgi:uncharacterized lipoprotein
MMRTRPLVLAACAALGCATARPTQTQTSTSTTKTTATPTATLAVTPGLAASEVRRRLGDPQRVERVPSSVSGGATYERWRYPDREVVLLDGKVIDVLP